MKNGVLSNFTRSHISSDRVRSGYEISNKVYFVFNSTKILKKIGNVTVKNYLNESLLSLLCFIIYGQGSFEEGLM